MDCAFGEVYADKRDVRLVIETKYFHYLVIENLCLPYRSIDRAVNNHIALASDVKASRWGNDVGSDVDTGPSDDLPFEDERAGGVEGNELRR